MSYKTALLYKAGTAEGTQHLFHHFLELSVMGSCVPLLGFMQSCDGRSSGKQAENVPLLWNSLHGSIIRQRSCRDTGRSWFVNFPRWSEDTAVSVAELGRDGKLTPYPNSEWNAWRNGW